MACLSLTLNRVQPATLAVGTVTAAKLALEMEPQPSMEVAVTPQATLSVTPGQQASLSVDIASPLVLIIGEVCAVSSGELTVLASTEGPLRNKYGGFFLLNPEEDSSS